MLHDVVTRDEWIEQRLLLLEEEKRMTQLLDRLRERRRALPWVRIDKDYRFGTTDGEATLADLFAGRSQLFVKHFMLGPGQPLQCVGCSLEVDHLDGILPHLENHDVSYVAVARATIEEIEVVRRKMGWRFRFVSSYGSDFNYDFNVSFRPEDMKAGRAVYNFQAMDPGIEDLSGDSVFYKDEAGQIFHAYSCYSRGAEQFLGIYSYIDVTPKGRDETGPYQSLGDWVRPRNMYGKGGSVEPTGRYHPPACGCAAHR